MTLLTVSDDLVQPDRIAMLSVHTSPLAQPGTGDAGGMNVYVLEVAKRMAASGIEVEIFTRATSSDQPPLQTVAERLLVRNVMAGPFQALRKEDLPAQLCAMTAAVLRAEAGQGNFDLVHSHYWLSGQVGWAATSRWDTPLVHSFHTLAKVKNRDRGEADSLEPEVRVTGEEQVVAAADRLVANTEAEAEDLIGLYGAAPHEVDVVHPGVDLETFTPGDQFEARRQFGLDPRRPVFVFVGRLQPLKAPDLLIAAAGRLAELGRGPGSRKAGDLPQIVICGGPSGNGDGQPEALRALAGHLGISSSVLFLPPLSKPDLAQLYRAATAVAVPSYSESFGLVAAEAQACGTPVLAAAVGGLPTAVAGDHSGLLLPNHRPDTWARAMARIIDQPLLRDRLAAGARPHAERFGWGATTADLRRSYSKALAARHLPNQQRRGA